MNRLGLLFKVVHVQVERYESPSHRDVLRAWSAVGIIGFPRGRRWIRDPDVACGRYRLACWPLPFQHLAAYRGRIVNPLPVLRDRRDARQKVVDGGVLVAPDKVYGHYGGICKPFIKRPHVNLHLVICLWVALFYGDQPWRGYADSRGRGAYRPFGAKRRGAPVKHRLGCNSIISGQAGAGVSCEYGDIFIGQVYLNARYPPYRAGYYPVYGLRAGLFAYRVQY